MAEPERKKRKTGGLQVTAEDLKWLREASNGGGAIRRSTRAG
jgi:hypothetical protein